MAVLQVITGAQSSLLQAARMMCERCTQFADVIATVPRFVDLNNNMNALIAQIDAAIIVKQSSRHTANVTNEKNARIATCLDGLGDLANILVDMALEDKNSDWETTAKRALRTKTKAMSEEGQLAVATEFLSFLKSIDQKRLAYYGIEDSELAGLEEQIKDIKALRLRKEMTVDQKSLDNDNLANLCVLLKDEKAKMERLSNRFSTKAPEFYAAFQKASVINLKVGFKASRTPKEKTPQQLAVIAAKGAAKEAQKAVADAKKEEEKAKKTKATVNKQTNVLGANSLTNGNKPTGAASNTILMVGKS